MGKIQMTVDGNTAAAYVAYAYTDVAAIYPITPSSNMAEAVDEWAAQGRENIFGHTVSVVEMQSEAGAAGTFHGALQAGALTTTFTASQGLLLMIPNMYKVAGELLPGVFHVSARALAAQALSIFGDHQDVMAARQTGCIMIASGSVQEVMDIAPVAHLSAIRATLPVVHFFDGFRTSHEIQKIEALEYQDFASLVDYEAVERFREKALSPNHPVTRGTAQNPDIYFQTREVSNVYYEESIPIIEDYFNKVGELTGRKYGLFDYYGASDATSIIIAIGSVTQTIEETIDYLNAKGEKYGVVKVHLYRPFSVKHLFEAIPSTVKKIAVIDRTKEPGAIGEPLYMDICSAYIGKKDVPMIVGGRYGLSSKDTTPTQIKAIYDNLKEVEPRNHFTLGIVDDVTHTSLELPEKITTAAPDTIRCKFWGLGSDGTVGANKQAIKIIGEHTDLYAQAYFDYDSKKSGGITMSHLRFGKSPIRATYLIDEADYIACHNSSYIHKYDVTKGLKKGGIFVLNWSGTEEALDKELPSKMKKFLVDNAIAFYCVNAHKISEEIGLGNRINMIMQSIFFKLAKIIPVEDAVTYLKEAVVKAYGKKGEQVVAMNQQAIEEGIKRVVRVELPQSWANAVDEKEDDIKEPEFITKIMRVMDRQEGDSLPVSAFKERPDGTFPSGTTAYEKRGIGVNVPEWIIEHCIQCNQCAYVCPHACIRPFLVDEKEQKEAPETFKTKPAIGKAFTGLGYRMQVDPMDCTGCGNCVDICPAKEKALVMQKLNTQKDIEVPNWAYAISQLSYKGDLVPGKTVKDSQFKTPLMEFSGACAGCGETPYIKLVTQLFGDRMMIANATGCSSIWGGSAPATPYTCNHEGKGPSWANSLFEDNAEYGYGMYLAVKQIRHYLKEAVLKLEETTNNQPLKEAAEKWLAGMDDAETSKEASQALLEIVRDLSDKNEATAEIKQIMAYEDYLVKRSVWIVGGDGWAYDIGYGGLDHVMASGEDINVFVFDTEIYSNTGGQASKSTPLAAIAKFAASGKRQGKKDLGRMMMTYGNVYVAQVAMGADKNQLIKTLIEAENYKGPSIIIAYAPCISHGLKEGMGKSIANMDRAVKAGYWHLYRYNPDLKAVGKNPFSLDSKPPTESFRAFIMSQVRYTSLLKQSKDEAEALFQKAEEQANEKYLIYKKMSEKV